MKKQQNRKEQDEKMRRLVRRNWIMAAVSLMLAVLAYFFIK